LIIEGRSGFVWRWSLVRSEAVLAIARSALALPLYYWLLHRMESFQLTASQWLVTVVGVSEGLMLVREAPGWRLLVGGGIFARKSGLLTKHPAWPGKASDFKVNRAFP
jgi:hypothetical protein